MSNTNDTPNVYIACLACYNAGRLHGVRVDAVDADVIGAAQVAMQAECGHTDNDWAIHDQEGFGHVTPSESMSFTDLAALGAAIEEHGAAYLAYVGNVGSDYATPEGFADSYVGEYASKLDYAYSYVEDTGMLDGVNQLITSYFDYEAFARDLFMDGHTFTDGYVFRDC